MKWYPFWKAWYFSREQRLGIIAMVILILIISIIKGPVLNYYYQLEKEKIEQNSIQTWNNLQLQIDSSLLAKKQYNDSLKTVKSLKKQNDKVFDNTTSQPKSSTFSVIDINSANAESFKQLYGIGEVLSKRIVAYRDKLGGFHRKEQLMEVYGINDSLYLSIHKKLTIKKKTIAKLNINTADLETLQNHPYISKTLAKQIFNYRSKINSFENIEEIKKMYEMNDSIYNKLYPYLTIY